MAEIQGRLTKDPEIRYTQDNVPVAHFCLAVEQDHRANGQEERGVDFIDCVAWRGSADYMAKYFKKGDMCIAKGRIRVREWTDKDGNRRRNLEIVVENAYFCGSRGRAGGDDYAGDYGA